MLSKQQLVDMYGKEYVDAFDREQGDYRLRRLLGSVNLSEDYRVADFGCGNGMLYPLLSGKIKSYTGIDFSEDFIRLANAKYAASPDAQFIQADIAEYCAANPGSFDVAFAMDFSEHVYDEEWLQVLTAIRQSLKDNGVLYIHTPNAEYFLEIMKHHNFIVKQFPGHIAVRNIDDNRKLLERAGYELRKVDLLPHYNIMKLLHPLSFIPLVGKYFKARIFMEAAVRRDAGEISPIQ